MPRYQKDMRALKRHYKPRTHPYSKAISFYHTVVLRVTETIRPHVLRVTQAVTEIWNSYIQPNQMIETPSVDMDNRRCFLDEFPFDESIFDPNMSEKELLNITQEEINFILKQLEEDETTAIDETVETCSGSERNLIRLSSQRNRKRTDHFVAETSAAYNDRVHACARSVG